MTIIIINMKALNRLNIFNYWIFERQFNFQYFFPFALILSMLFFRFPTFFIFTLSAFLDLSHDPLCIHFDPSIDSRWTSSCASSASADNPDEHSSFFYSFPNLHVQPLPHWSTSMKIITINKYIYIYIW